MPSGCALNGQHFSPNRMKLDVSNFRIQFYIWYHRCNYCVVPACEVIFFSPTRDTPVVSFVVQNIGNSYIIQLFLHYFYYLVFLNYVHAIDNTNNNYRHLLLEYNIIGINQVRYIENIKISFNKQRNRAKTLYSQIFRSL